nr:kinesin-like protein KIN-14R [Ipomoea batatas]
MKRKKRELLEELKKEKKMLRNGDKVRKTDECYQSWMSVSAANQHLEKVRMELDNKTFQTYSLDQNLEKQALKLTEISSRYEHDKQVWCGAISNLEQKVKVFHHLVKT